LVFTAAVALRSPPSYKSLAHMLPLAVINGHR